MTQEPQIKTIRDQMIRVKASRHQRDLIDRAARVLGKSRSSFVLDAAYREAEEVVLDQTHFVLDAEAFGRFQEMLDNPPAPTNRLRILLQRKARWE